MELLRDFNELDKNDVALAGGKGASLGEMTKASIPVPPGFVVLAEAFEQFIKETGIDAEIESQLHKLNHQDINSVEKMSEEIRALIKNAEFPVDIKEIVMKHYKSLNAEFVAVRSSATAEDSSSASWAGELESYLNTTEDKLLDTIKECWSSLFTPRAIFYRFEKKLHTTKVSVAVVVQKMVQSEISGICFTVHPVTEDHDQLVIEAGYGLGEAIVGGIITPDTYVVLKGKSQKANVKSVEDSNYNGSLPILDKYISQQEIMITKRNGVTEEYPIEPAKQELQKLTDEKIIELANICIGIEKHYGFPCDIEWAMEKDVLYITQSRPITTLS
jgi:pyruvate,water dikinase